MNSRMKKESLFSLLEPTPIDERLVMMNHHHMNSQGSSSGQAESAPLSFMTRDTHNEFQSFSLAQGTVAPPSLFIQRAELDEFCEEDFLKEFDGDASSLGSDSPEDEDVHPPRANDFFSAPWFQGLESASPATSSNDPFKMLPSSSSAAPAPPQHQMILDFMSSSSFATAGAVYSSEPARHAGSGLSLTQSSMMTLLAEPALVSSSNSSTGSSSRQRVPNISDSQSLRWMERYNELVAFKSQHGHCCIPSYWPANTPLAQWVKRQRYQYKLRHEERNDRPSTLTDERIAMLEDLGFVWDSHAVFWEERWNELNMFKDLTGHTNVPTKYKENPQLGVWCKCQRRQYKIFRTEGPAKSYLTLGRIAKLMEIGFVFDPRANAKRRTKKTRS